MKFHLSRWKFWWAYALVFVLIMLAIWFTDRANDASSYVAGGIAILLFIVFEIIIRRERINVVDTGIEYRKGKNIKHFPFSSISSVELSQSAFQKLVRSGDVHIQGHEHIILKGFEEVNKIVKAVKR